MSRPSNVAGLPQSIEPNPPQRPEIVLKCGCGLPAARFVSQTEANPGRAFYQCPNASGWTKCKLWQWEDQIFRPNVRAGPQTSSSWQPGRQPDSQTMTPECTRPTSPQANLIWTSFPAMHLSSVATRNKRKRSPSPLPGTSTLPSVAISVAFLSPRTTRAASTTRAAILAALNREDVDEASTSAAPGDNPDVNPARKRVRIDDQNPGTLYGGEIDEDIEEIAMSRRLDFTSTRPTTQEGPMLEHDPSNPFLVPRSSPANETGAVPAAPVPTSTTEPLSAISQLENTLLQLVSSLPSLKHQVTVLERKKIADTRSVEQT